MKRLLCIVGSMNAGGAETFLMKVYRCLDKTKFQLDFAVADNEKGYYDDEIHSLGGKIHRITPKSKSVFRNFSDIAKLVWNEKYIYVLRTSQHSLSAMELCAAKFGGAKVRVFRSSNSSTTSGRGKDLLLHQLFTFMPILFANIKIAPSTEAAEFMFGDGCIQKGKAALLHNGIDFSIYRYSEKIRVDIRRELCIEDKFVVGHVGRFSQQKNHEFLLHIFSEMRITQHNAVLLLIGKGELEDQIKETAKKLDILESIIFLGIRSNTAQLYNAMDVLVFPSLYEGMPNVVIESQATGLPSVISSTITKEANITGLVQYLSLHEPVEVWAKAAIEAANILRIDTHNDFLANRYDIESVVSTFQQLIFCSKNIRRKE